MPPKRNRRGRHRSYNSASQDLQAHQEEKIRTIDFTIPMKLDFFPNSCPICQATENLKRCNNCSMIYYCEKEHQKQHWPHHKEFCKVVKTINNEKGISHLYQNLKGLNSQKWKLEVELLIDKVKERLNRFLHLFEMKVLMFPRVCHVCYETTPQLLKNCPGCPAASFCQNHTDSALHDEVCSKIKEIHEIVKEINFEKQTTLLRNIWPILTSIKIDKSSILPTSSIEFFRQFAESKMKLPTNDMIFLSNVLNDQLTIFNAIKILDYSDSDLVIHIEDAPSTEKEIDNNSPYWEVLLHLLPHLKNVKILFLNEDFSWKMDLELCKQCHLSKKKMFLDAYTLPWIEYANTTAFEIPNVMIFPNVQPEDFDDELLITWQVKITRCRNMNFPLVFTTYRQEEPIEFRGILKSTLGNFQTRYDGVNKFGTLSSFRHFDNKICQLSRFLIVIDPPESKSFRLKSFFAAYCAKCNVAPANLPCQKCKMIFYCDKPHRNEHSSEHQDICYVVSEMLSETGGTSIFDKLKKTNQESWVRAKVDLMLKVKTKLGRKLSNFEKEMFLFPKTCAICYESNLRKLENCMCGTSLCKIHKNDLKHRENCSKIAYAYDFANIIQRIKSFYGDLTAHPGIDINTFQNVQEFITESYKLKYDNQLDDYTKTVVPTKLVTFFSVQKVIFSNMHTRPLTVVSALKKLGFQVNTKMVIHVIGANGMEMGNFGYWMILFYLLDPLTDLVIIFIGPEVFNACLDESYLDNFFKDSYFVINENVNLEVKCHALKYDEYCKSDSFVAPDVIVGFNLNLHESAFGISECTWKDTIITVRELEVPFILTAGTKDRARQDHRRLCELLGNPVDYFCLERNRFSGEIPERDFETGGILHSNQYLIIYEKQDENATGKSPNLENPVLQKFSELSITTKLKTD